jgi:predicted acyl esterase
MFTSDPLEKDLEVLGVVTVELTHTVTTRTLTCIYALAKSRTTKRGSLPTSTDGWIRTATQRSWCNLTYTHAHTALGKGGKYVYL